MNTWGSVHNEECFEEERWRRHREYNCDSQVALITCLSLRRPNTFFTLSTITTQTIYLHLQLQRGLIIGPRDLSQKDNVPVQHFDWFLFTCWLHNFQLQMKWPVGLKSDQELLWYSDQFDWNLNWSSPCLETGWTEIWSGISQVLRLVGLKSNLEFLRSWDWLDWSYSGLETAWTEIWPRAPQVLRLLGLKSDLEFLRSWDWLYFILIKGHSATVTSCSSLNYNSCSSTVTSWSHSCTMNGSAQELVWHNGRLELINSNQKFLWFHDQLDFILTRSCSDTMTSWP